MSLVRGAIAQQRSFGQLLLRMRTLFLLAAGMTVVGVVTLALPPFGIVGMLRLLLVLGPATVVILAFASLFAWLQRRREAQQLERALANPLGIAMVRTITIRRRGMDFQHVLLQTADGSIHRMFLEGMDPAQAEAAVAEIRALAPHAAC